MPKMKESEKREAFKYLWEHREELQTDEQLVQQVISERLKYVPKKKLYKYRTCTNNNFKTLADNSIWMAPASNFLDPFDCTINIDPKRNAKEADRWVAERYPTYSYSLARGLCEERGIPMPFTKEDIAQYISTCMDDEGNVNEEKECEFILSHTVSEEIEETVKSLVTLKYVRERFMEVEDSMISQLSEAIELMRTYNRNTQLIYCMAEHYDISSLWENYGSTYSGFCIEYDFTRFYEHRFDDYKNLVYLFPMTYRVKKPSFNMIPFWEGVFREVFLRDSSWQNNTDINVDLNMQLYYKKKSYDYEREWRFAIRNRDNNKQYFPFVSALYAGKDMKPRNLARLRNIAKKLGVPVYQQVPNKANNGFDYILIEEVKV